MTLKAQIQHEMIWRFFSYTSGTTGNPKAVTHSHGWGYAHLQMAPKHWLCIQENDSCMGNCSTRVESPFIL